MDKKLLYRICRAYIRVSSQEIYRGAEESMILTYKIKHGTGRKTEGDNENRQLLKCETPYYIYIIPKIFETIIK